MPHADLGGRRSRLGLTLVEVTVVISIVGVIACLVLNAVQASRSAAARLGCLNNLAQIGMGLHAHQSAFGIFPPQVPAVGGSVGSTTSYEGITWHVYVLPFIDQSPLWAGVEEAFRANPSPLSAVHGTVRSISIQAFICPADRRLFSASSSAASDGGAFTSYAGMTGCISAERGGVFGVRTGVAPQSITDGLSNTIMIGERPPPGSLSMGWWYTNHPYTNLMSATDGECPADTGVCPGAPECQGISGIGTARGYFFSPGDLNNDCDKLHYWSLHGGGANFLFADGSAKLLTYSARYQLRGLATIAGGEVESQY
jgi:prepilin-type processing-associated H-X9-DG protein/prepilin-type N-terminal cleavage/methylation domain-containing protein